MAYRELERGEDSGWIWLAANLYYRKKNGYVTIRFAVSGLTSDAWNTLGTLPDGYRPDYTVIYIGSNGGYSPSYDSLVNVLDTGEIRAKPYGGTYAYGSVTFPV